MRIMHPVPQPGMIILPRRRRCIAGLVRVGSRARRERAMEQPRVERRLAAVLAADVAGYSRLIGADEEDTLARLKAESLPAVAPGSSAPPRRATSGSPAHRLRPRFHADRGGPAGRARRPVGLIRDQARIAREFVERRQPGCRPRRLTQRHRAIDRDDRRAQRQQPIVELENSMPVGPAGGPPRGMHRLHRRLELEPTDPA